MYIPVGWNSRRVADHNWPMYSNLHGRPQHWNNPSCCRTGSCWTSRAVCELLKNLPWCCTAHISHMNNRHGGDGLTVGLDDLRGFQP